MTKADTALTLLLILIGIALAAMIETMWLSVLVIAMSAAIPLMFLARIQTERCRSCGHYFTRNFVEAYLARNKSNRCADCRPQHVPAGETSPKN